MDTWLQFSLLSLVKAITTRKVAIIEITIN